MGSSSSKFRKHLQNGDEVAAINVYNNHSDLRKALDPNCSYGDNYQHETPLHYAARHGMKSLLRIFLNEHGGNPNKTNGRKETALHCVCMEKSPQFYPVQRRRMECLSMMLQWRGAELKDGEIERVDLASVDEKDNTSLHYAASSGLKGCVELLVSHNSPLFMENKENHTPCDCAESNGFNDIALFLESKMVFSNDSATESIDEVPPDIHSEEYSGLRAQDLQEAKDQLLVETADMLSIPLFTAEALLRNHEWSREMLLDAWMSDALACCEKSGVTPPANLFSEKPIVAESLSSPTQTDAPNPFAECDICTLSFPMTEEPVHTLPCHHFCRECWQEYLHVKIKEGHVHDITCPAFGCTKLVPVEVIENVVSRDMARRYLQFDIKAFVDSNPNIKWCPYPGCGRAVKFPEAVEGSSLSMTSPRHSKIPADTSRAVDCGNGHYFCWECMGEAHEPCSCEQLRNWLGEINEIKPEKLDGTEQECETAANCLWLVTNSKPCPNCKSPIQKNEGCNHMKCSKCKYDFCWVCLDQWKRHNSSTGGYFKCNRYEVVKQVEDTSKEQIKEAEERNTKMQELNKFVHYYTRYKNHENSYKLEEPLLKTAKEKMLKLAEAVTDLATAKDETKFVEEAVHQLLKARRVLKCSYVYGYYLNGPQYKKLVFEFMQTELEECTEILSQMVNRLYLRTPRKKIIEQSQICHRKRSEFITAIIKGLVPPETPPGLRKKKRKYSMETEDEDLKKAILASIEDFDPENPWIIASGRHTNVAALLDWPSDDSDDSDSMASDARRQRNQDVSQDQGGSPEEGICMRENCSRRRAKNPRTEEYHNFCSLRCSRLHKQRREENTYSVPEGVLDEQMDLLRALEMSRIQFLKEQGVVYEDSDNRSDLTSSGEARSSNARPQKDDIYTPVERLDMEIKRLLEFSSASPDSGSDEPGKNSESSLNDKESLEELQKPSTSRFGENQSTVVSRVPNKSVEDLYHADCIGCPTGATGLSPLPHGQGNSQGGLDPDCFDFEVDSLESIGAYGGKVEIAENQSRFLSESDRDLDDVRVEGKILKKLLNTDKIDIPYQEILPSGASGFGIIKDISVSNLHIGDSDKTKEFAAKDLSSLSKPKPSSDRPGNGRLFAANTPGEDEKVFSLLSPESDFSESSSSEVWGFRPLRLQDQPYQQQTPETDSSIETCSCADLPNQNEHYMHGDVTSPVIGPNIDCSNVANYSKKSSSKEMSILEMTENLVQMTRHMQDTFSLHEQKLNNTGETQNLQNISEEEFVDDTLPEPPIVGSQDSAGEITSDLIIQQNRGTVAAESNQERDFSDFIEVQDLETAANSDIFGGVASIEAANENSGEITTTTGGINAGETDFDAADREASTYV